MPSSNLLQDDVASQNRHVFKNDTLRAMAHPFFDVSNPVIIGHRGAAGTAPENTLPSFARGLELGSEVLESDIHATRDGIPILLHDPSVERTTNGRGNASELTLAELRELDAGHHFTLDAGGSFPQRGQGVRIPTLEEAFEAFPKARFNLEIKANPTGLVGRVVELVEKYGRSDTTLLTAGEDPIMLELRRERAERAAGFAIGASLADIVSVIKAAVGNGPATENVMALQIPEDFGGNPLVTETLMNFAKAHEIAVHVWTINEAEDMKRLLDQGVEGLITDHPERMAALLGRA
ncbi:MAG: glycerophosphoryl diester phosphodiesterase [Myxococcota bacterium]